MKYYNAEQKGKSIFKIFLIYYISMLLFCTLRIVVQLGIFPDELWVDVLLSSFVQLGLLLLLPSILFCILFKCKPSKLIKDCNFNKVNYKVILISLGLGVLCFIINIAVSSLFNGVLTFTGYRFSSSGSADYSTLNFVIDILTVAILPAICEEFIHRGVLLQGIKHIGFKKAIVISSILFGLVHFNIQQVSYAIVVGLIMGFVSVVAKNIYPAMIIHFVNNFISTYISYASHNNWFGGNILNDIQSLLTSGKSLWIFSISALILIAVVSLLFLLVWLLYRQSIMHKVKKAIDKIYKGSRGVANNQPIHFAEERIIRELLENNTLLNLTYKKMDSPIEIVMPKEKTRYLWRSKDKIFMWASLILGALVTIFTYIWGLL